MLSFIPLANKRLPLPTYRSAMSRGKEYIHTYLDSSQWAQTFMTSCLRVADAYDVISAYCTCLDLILLIQQIDQHNATNYGYKDIGKYKNDNYKCLRIYDIIFCFIHKICQSRIIRIHHSGTLYKFANVIGLNCRHWEIEE